MCLQKSLCFLIKTTSTLRKQKMKMHIILSVFTPHADFLLFFFLTDFFFTKMASGVFKSENAGLALNRKASVEKLLYQ